MSLIRCECCLGILCRAAAHSRSASRLALCSFSELTDGEKQRASSPVVDQGGVPSFKVTIKGKEEVLSVHDVAVRYIRSLFLTAKDFLSGVPIAGAVLAVPLSWTSKQMEALKVAAKDAGLIVLQVLPAPAATVTAYGLTAPRAGGQLPDHPDAIEGGSVESQYDVGTELDRNVAVVDVGGSSTAVTVLSARAGIYSLLSSVTEAGLGGKQVDDALVAFFAKEFTKKTKVPVEENNARAWAKLRNEAEVTKRALSASSSAQCAVESLAEGVDFAGPINRIRLDLLAAPVYNKVVAKVQEALSQAGLEACQVDEVVLAGGSARLPGLTNALLNNLFAEGSRTKLTASIDSDQVIARGCAVHASTIAASTGEDSAERTFLLQLPLAPPSEIPALKAPATSKPIGLVLPAPSQANGSAGPVSVDGQLFVTLVPAQTPLPARRVYTLPASQAGTVVLEFAEGKSEVKVEKVEPASQDDDDEELLSDEEEEIQERRIPVVRAEKGRLAAVSYEAKQKGEQVRVEIVLIADGTAKITVGEGSNKKEVSLSAP